MNQITPQTKLEERLVLAATRSGTPLGGAFELTPRCNMDCRMCFLRLSEKERAAQGRLRTAQEWLKLAEEARKEGMLFLLLTGGEPFLYPEFEELYCGLAKLGIYLTLNTNGTMITEKEADLLAKHLPRRVNITLYGSSDEIYERLCRNPRGFSQTERAVRLLQERRVPLKLNGSLARENGSDLPNIQRIAREWGIPLEVDSYLFPAARKGIRPFEEGSRLTPEEAADGYVQIKQEELSPEAFDQLAKGMRECYHRRSEGAEQNIPEVLPCRAGRSSFWVTWKGEMTPCVFLDRPQIPVFKTGFVKAWEELRASREHICLPAACGSCWMRPYCTVCGAAAYTETGSTETVPAYLCAMTEAKLRKMSRIAEEQRKDEGGPERS